MDYLNKLVNNLTVDKSNELILIENQATSTNEIIISNSDNYKLILLDLNDIFKNNIQKKYKIINWIKNRPADKYRVNEIYEYYKINNIDLVPGIIYVWQNINKLHIYDGLHRFLAAKKLIKNNKINSLKVLLYINLSNNEQDIIDEFTKINKSIPIPSIYLENEVLLKKQICQNISEEFCKSYPDFISTSRKPHIYNFNRDLLIEWISSFDLDFNIKNLDKIIFKILIKLNDKAKDQIQNGNIIHPKKCDKYNFYLFYLEKNYIKKEVEHAINQIF